jgi:hypothetical protein
MATKMLRLPVNGGETDELRISLSEYKGKRYLDIRRYYLPDGVEPKKAKADDFRPTSKGVTVRSVEHVDEIVTWLTENRDDVAAYIEGGEA